MEWIAEWAAKEYARLYQRFGKRSFDFDSARELLQADEYRMSRIIQELEKSGFLYRRRKSVDMRRRLYYLVSPDDAVRALALQPPADILDDKLRAVRAKVDYLVTNGAAAYRYHRYLTPERTDIKIRRKDLGFWIAFLKTEYTRIAVNGHSPEKGPVGIDLHPTLTDTDVRDAVDVDGLALASMERVLASSLREGSESSIVDALALVIVKRKELDWKSLAATDVRQEVGFCMAAVNKAAGEDVFSGELIDTFRSTTALPKRFGTLLLVRELPAEYSRLAEDWLLEVRVPPRIFTKVVRDLADRISDTTQ